MYRIFIYRGLPGSGKNTDAEDRDVDVIIDSDSYHVNENGEYDFDESNATAAHAACFRRYLSLLAEAEKYESIAVCNTNCTRAEYTPYVQAARAFGLGSKVRLVHCRCSVDTSLERNIHEVPKDVIKGMDARWEEPESYDPTQLVIHTD